MNRNAMDHDEPIVALATPFGRAAVAVVRTSGEGAVELVARCFSRPEALRRARGYTVHHGRMMDPADGSVVDEVLCTVFRAPRSYTGQESVEISTHGSRAVVEALLSLLTGRGFRSALPGEFTMRAFLNGKVDLTRAEAVRELVDSQTAAGRSLALHRLSGAVERRIRAVKEHLLEVLATVEVQLDYGEDELEDVPVDAAPLKQAGEQLRRLAATYEQGRLYQEGVRVALAGPTNAGKSSLFNLFAREERSIVSEHHGTTRDYIEREAEIEGIPVRLYDTAGLRDVGEALESEGIRRSSEIIRNADLVLYLVDGAVGVSDEDDRLIDSLREEKRVIAVWSKLDLAGAPPEGFVGVSAETAEGFDQLRRAIAERLTAGITTAAEEVVIDSERQRRLLETAVGAIDRTAESVYAGEPADVVAVDLQEAIQLLGEITGEVTTDDLLDTMFGSFCVGK